MANRTSVTELLAARKPRGKARRLRDRRAMAHKPSGVGKGRWHSRTSLWKSKREDRRKRLISNASRRQNRGL